MTALVANQTSAAVAGVLPLLPGHGLRAVSPSIQHFAFSVLSACVALATFVLVRSWVSYGDRHRNLPRHPRHSCSATVGFGSAVALTFMAVSCAALWLWHAGRAFFGVETVSYPLAPGSLNDWVLAAAKASVAGVVEEPVYVGLIVLLWPRLRMTTVIPLALCSSGTRTVMHLYYASDSRALIPAVALVAVWCAVWSTASLLLVYLSRSLWPVIVGHGLLNVLMTTNGPYTDHADGIVPAYMLVILIGLVLGTVLIGSLSVARRLFVTPMRELPVLLRI
ncbi:CPBP family glutamic-type intramembrane protease [Mycolicibacterium alvei]|nr:CPBP family glutamic-type intramembrane protease [Mycolicibacterium alvei]MCV7003483.1 hypothetical protein [Mycolicibacterium alvei]